MAPERSSLMTMIKVREPAGSDSQGNVVQFASQIFYCTEEELEAHVVVQRLGIVEAVRSEAPFTTGIPQELLGRGMRPQVAFGVSAR